MCFDLFSIRFIFILKVFVVQCADFGSFKKVDICPKNLNSKSILNIHWISITAIYSQQQYIIVIAGFNSIYRFTVHGKSASADSAAVHNSLVSVLHKFIVASALVCLKTIAISLHDHFLKQYKTLGRALREITPADAWKKFWSVNTYLEAYTQQWFSGHRIVDAGRVFNVYPKAGFTTDLSIRRIERCELRIKKPPPQSSGKMRSL